MRCIRDNQLRVATTGMTMGHRPAGQSGSYGLMVDLGDRSRGRRRSNWRYPHQSAEPRGHSLIRRACRAMRRDTGVNARHYLANAGWIGRYPGIAGVLLILASFG